MTKHTWSKISILSFFLFFCFCISLSWAQTCPINTVGLSKSNYSGKQGEVLALQMMLAVNPDIYPEGIMSGTFGNATEKAVKKIQSDNGLNLTGILDQDTIDTVCDYYNTCPWQTLLLSKDSEETYEIKALQSILTFLGYYSSGVTGTFGPKTEAGLIKYQKAKDLYPTGLVDYDTQTQLCDSFSILNTVKPKLTTPSTTKSTNTLKVSCYASPNPVKINQNVTFYASVSGGTGVYTYEWYGSGSGDKKSFNRSFTSAGNYDINLRITDSLKQVKTAKCSVSVYEPAKTGISAILPSFLFRDTNPSVKLTSNVYTINQGDSINLTWSSKNVSNCFVLSSPGISGFTGSISISGSKTISNIQQTTLFSIMCTKDDSSTFDYLTIMVGGGMVGSTSPSTTATSTTKQESFCGSSKTGSYCSQKSDCIVSGCSSQICQSRFDKEEISTCEYRECYDALKYAMECSCMSSKCQWVSKSSTSSTTSTTKSKCRIDYTIDMSLLKCVEQSACSIRSNNMIGSYTTLNECQTELEKIKTPVKWDFKCLTAPRQAYTGEPVGYLTDDIIPGKQSINCNPCYRATNQEWVDVFDVTSKISPVSANTYLQMQPHGSFVFKAPGEYKLKITKQWAGIDMDDKNNLLKNFSGEAICTFNIKDKPDYYTVFMTNKTYTGAVEGLIRADKICNDTIKSINKYTVQGQFKALLAPRTIKNGTYRLIPNTSSNTFVDKGFVCDYYSEWFPLYSYFSYSDGTGGSGGTTPWPCNFRDGFKWFSPSGYNYTWASVIQPFSSKSTGDCNLWTSSSKNDTGSALFSTGKPTCNEQMYLMCVSADAVIE